ncbi:FG-GAP repeat domain-containing protein [Rugosimonospora africana]|nr:VCBS repeat-containing protein [Rugosimonospora africana]
MTAFVALTAASPAVADPVAGTGPQAPPASKPPAEVAVVAPLGQANHPQDSIVVAGATGFLHHHDGSTDFLWTRYDTGATTVVSDLAKVGDNAIRPAGGDAIVIKGQVASHPAPTGTVSVVDLANQSWQQWAVPAGYQVNAVYGSTALVTAVQNSAVTAIQLWTFAADGTFTVKPVTGLPADASISVSPPTTSGGAPWAVVRYASNGVGYYSLLSLTSGVATSIPVPQSSVTQFLVSGDHVACAPSGAGTVHVFSISGLTTGTDTTSQDVVLSGAATFHIGLTGDHLIASAVQANAETPARDFPLSGGGGSTLVPAVPYPTQGVMAQASDGSVLVIGGSGISDWAVHRFSAASGGSLTDHALPLRDPLTNAGLTLDHGLLRHAQSGLLPSGGPHFVLQNHLLVAPDSGETAPSENGGTLSDQAVTCATGVRCVSMVDGNTYGVAYVSTSTAGSIDLYTGTVHMTLPATGGTLVDASTNYAIVDATSPATQYVVEPGYGSVVRSGPVTGAALWYSTLWTATTTPGQLAAIDLPTGKTTQTVSTGASCVPSEVQASARWLYWSCASGAAGLVNLQYDTAVSLPHLAGPAMLGDGYLVWHDGDAGSLEMFDFHTGQLGRRLPGTEPRFAPPTPVKLASLPAGPVADDRNIDWTVDKYGGDVAYVAADGAVHVVDTGVPPSPTDLADMYVPQLVYPGSTYPDFQVYYAVTRPVASWTLSITRDIGDQTVFTTSDGPARTSIRAYWTGLLSSGAKAISGAYTWHLTVVPAGGSAPQPAGTGSFSVYCGQMPFRSYGCNGSPALLGVMGNWQGESHWYEGTSDGALRDNGFTDTWLLGSGSWQFNAIVPFGDFDGDGLSDILARDGAGVLHAYLGLGQTYFNTEIVKSIKIGTGWGGYTLTSPGDLNRDGKADLLARDSAGRLWLYPGTGKGSVGSRVETGPGWNIYSRLIGAGDLNGDGIGDLLAVDASGVMWRYNGTGNGGLGARVQIGPGWGGYNAIIGIGDLNLDGNNDLVARDSAGKLWEYPGNGAGSFSARILEGSGFQKYQAIY